MTGQGFHSVRSLTFLCLQKLRCQVTIWVAYFVPKNYKYVVKLGVSRSREAQGY